MSDQDKISPYSIGTIWRRQVMRIKKNTYQGIVIWSNTKFSKVTLRKNCLSGRMENYYWDLGSERVNWKFECYCTKEEPIQEFRVYWSVIDIGCNFLVSSCALISLTFNGSSLNIENIPKIYDRGFLFTWFCEFHGGKSCIDFFHFAVWSVNGLSMHLGALCRLKFHSWGEVCYAWSHNAFNNYKLSIDSGKVCDFNCIVNKLLSIQIWVSVYWRFLFILIFSYFSLWEW